MIITRNSPLAVVSTPLPPKEKSLEAPESKGLTFALRNLQIGLYRKSSLKVHKEKQCLESLN